jgi:hypothetical protein
MLTNDDYFFLAAFLAGFFAAFFLAGTDTHLHSLPLGVGLVVSFAKHSYSSCDTAVTC